MRLSMLELLRLRENALANDGQVERWLDLNRSLRLIEEVIALRAEVELARERRKSALARLGGPGISQEDVDAVDD